MRLSLLKIWLTALGAVVALSGRGEGLVGVSEKDAFHALASSALLNSGEVEGDVAGARIVGPYQVVGRPGLEVDCAILAVECMAATRVVDTHLGGGAGVRSANLLERLYGSGDGVAPDRVLALGTKEVVDHEPSSGYRPVVMEIVAFFETEGAPAPFRETVERFALLGVGDERKRRAGARVRIDATMMEHAE